MRRLINWFNILIKKRKELKRWQRIVTVLAAVITFATTYALILPAITVEKDNTGEVAGMYLEKAADQDVLQEENALEPVGVSIDADETNAATVEDGAVETDAEIPEYDDYEEEDETGSPAEDDGEEIETALPVKVLKAFGSDYTVILSYDETSGIPDEAILDVSEIPQNSEEYQTYLKEAKKAMGLKEEETLPSFAARFFDIKIIVDDQEFTPETGVSVEITYTEPLAEHPETAVSAVHFADESAEAEVIEANTAEIQDDGQATVEFTAESFSVYGVIYTVDFHWEVNGKTYDFRIPGGGFVSLEHLVEVLGIGVSDSDSDSNDTNGPGDAADIDNEAALKFTSYVESVDFSSPELVWVNRVNEDTTVGELKEANELEVEYSADLTEEQIADINAQTVEAGDWALICIHPFTTDETLTVTMKNGEKFAVRVTDAQLSSLSEINGDQGYLIYTKVGTTYYVLKNDGTTEAKSASELDYLNNSYKWKFKYVYTDAYGQAYYNIYPVTDEHSTLTLNWFDQDLVQDGASNIVVSPETGGFTFWGYNHVVMTLDGTTFKGQHGPYHVVDTHRIIPYVYNPNGQEEHEPCVLAIYEQRPIGTYEFDVYTDNMTMGYVSGKNKNGNTDGGSGEAGYITITNTDKTNKYAITATRQSEKYMFDYWDLDGTPLDRDEYPATIPANRLHIPQNQSTLTAHFKRDPTYTPPDDFKEGREVNITELTEWLEELENQTHMMDPNGYLKTAELYDYANRIYRVDLEAKSDFTTISGKVDLGFVLDNSSSMDFPANLIMQESLGEIAINQINDSNNNKNWLPDKSKIYYLISDKSSTATVYKLQWYNNAWYRQDASKEGYGEKISSTTTFSGNPKEVGLSYPIYLAEDDNVKRNDVLYDSVADTLEELKTILGRVSVATAADKDKEPEVKTAWLAYAKRLQGIPQYNFTSNKVTVMSPDYTPKGGTSTDIALLAAAGYKRFDETRNSNWNKDQMAYSKTEISNYPSFDGTNYTANSVYIEDSSRGFDWEPNSKKYVILITDGAPQRDGYDVDYQTNPTPDGKHDNVLVPDAANYLKAGEDGILGTDDDVTLITVGLSMGEVRKGSVLLWNLATRDSEGDPYFYDVTDPEELKYALYEILTQVVGKAIIVGNVTDTINEAFYPVDILTGERLEQGHVINLKGERIAKNVNYLTNEQKADGYGTIKIVDGKYTVEWKDQNIPESKWHGIVYVKAKEDFLGGNAVRTNDPDKPAEFKATGYRMDPQDVKINLDSAKQETHTIETPRVNVNELNLTQNSTQWTVYLGTEVDPVSQINALFDNIMVEEVVKKNTARDSDGDSLKDEVNGGQTSYRFTKEISREDNKERNPDPSCETFPMKTLIQKIIDNENSKNHTSLTLNQIMEQAAAMCRKPVKPLTNPGEPEPEEPEGGWNTGYILPYSLYGQDCPGTVTIQLVADHDYTVHDTDVLGAPAETYTLIVKFAPDYDAPPIGQGGTGQIEYHTGQFQMGYQGNAAGEDTSSNQHVINTYVKPLDVLKYDDDNQLIDDKTATFRLLRAWTAADAADIGSQNRKVTLKEADGYKLSVNKMTGDYYLVEEVDTVNGIAHFGTGTDVSTLLEYSNSPYYLIEWTPPSGYKKDVNAKIITVQTGENVYKALDKVTTLTQAQIATRPYNWNQGVTIKADNTVLEYVDADGEVIVLTNPSNRNYVFSNITNTYNFKTDPEGVFVTSVVNELSSVPVSIKKVDIGNTNKLLGNAVFSLYGSDAVDANGKLKTDADPITTGITTDADEDLGFADLGELDAGTYYLVETSAPIGYVLPEYEYIRITIDSGVVRYQTGTTGEPKTAVIVTRNEQDVHLLEVYNYAGVSLPATGGPGTDLIYFLGIILTSLAGAGLMMRKRCKTW